MSYILIGVLSFMLGCVVGFNFCEEMLCAMLTDRVSKHKIKLSSMYGKNGDN